MELISEGPAGWRIFLFNIFDHAPQLINDFSWPEQLMKGFVKNYPMLFTGGATSITHMHFDMDMSHILHTQFLGRKRVLLFPNEEQYKLGNILELTKMQNAREMFVDFDNFCTYFLSNVIGKQAYNKRVHQETISCITTVSDEAFVVLCLENSMKRWEHEAANPTEKRIEAVYTASPAEASKYGGLSRRRSR